MWDTSRKEFSAHQLLKVFTIHVLGKAGLPSFHCFLYKTVSQFLCESPIFGPIWSISLAVAFCGVERTRVGGLSLSPPTNKQVAKLCEVLLPYVLKQPECFLRLSRQKRIYTGLSWTSEPFGEIPLDLGWMHECTHFHNLPY